MKYNKKEKYVDVIKRNIAGKFKYCCISSVSIIVK